MRSATEWLASSDDEDSQAKPRTRNTPQKPVGFRRKSRTPSPTTQSITIPESDSPTAPRGQTQLAARLREAEERRKKQEELRERMKATLGHTAVEAIAETAAAAAAAKKANVLVSDDSFTSGPIPSSLPPVVPSARNSTELRRRGIPDHMEEMELMLADRGTQTVETVECQTDPEPRVLHCAQCYAEYYGHVPALSSCPHGGEDGWGRQLVGPQDNGYLGTDPIFAGLMQRYATLGLGAGSRGNHVGPALPSRQRAGGAVAGAGIEYGMSNAIHTTSLLRDQLNCVQSSIDMLISRYNLPAPPGMEHLAAHVAPRSTAF